MLDSRGKRSSCQWKPRHESPHVDSPAFFVVGCPRSGTTLLQRMLDAHPWLAVVNDSHFIPRALEKLDPALITAVERHGDVPLSRSLVESVTRYHRFPRLGLEASDVSAAAAASSTYREFVTSLYRALAKRHGKRMAAEKTPDYARRLPLLSALFPWAKVIHIIRDGRDAALSILSWTENRKGPAKLPLWTSEPLGASALWWRWLVQQARRDGAALGGRRYLEVRYEQLVVEPTAQLQRACAFLDVPFTAAMVAYNAGKQKARQRRSAKKAWLPPTVGLRDWRSQMSPEDIALFEALSGDLLAEMDYPLTSPALARRTASRAATCLEAWSDPAAASLDSIGTKAREQ